MYRTRAGRDVVAKAARTLREFRIGGVETNIAFLQAVLADPDFVANRISTSFIDSHVATLVGAAKTAAHPLFFAVGAAGPDAPRRSERALWPVRPDRRPFPRRCKVPWWQSR